MTSLSPTDPYLPNSQIQNASLSAYMDPGFDADHTQVVLTSCQEAVPGESRLVTGSLQRHVDLTQEPNNKFKYNPLAKLKIKTLHDSGDHGYHFSGVWKGPKDQKIPLEITVGRLVKDWINSGAPEEEQMTWIFQVMAKDAPLGAKILGTWLSQKDTPLMDFPLDKDLLPAIAPYMKKANIASEGHPHRPTPWTSETVNQFLGEGRRLRSLKLGPATHLPEGCPTPKVLRLSPFLKHLECRACPSLETLKVKGESSLETMKLHTLPSLMEISCNPKYLKDLELINPPGEEGDTSSHKNVVLPNALPRIETFRLNNPAQTSFPESMPKLKELMLVNPHTDLKIKREAYPELTDFNVHSYTSFQ